MLSMKSDACRSGAQWNSGSPMFCLQWQEATGEGTAEVKRAEIERPIKLTPNKGFGVQPTLSIRLHMACVPLTLAGARKSKYFKGADSMHICSETIPLLQSGSDACSHDLASAPCNVDSMLAHMQSVPRYCVSKVLLDICKVIFMKIAAISTPDLSDAYFAWVQH